MDRVTKADRPALPSVASGSPVAAPGGPTYRWALRTRPFRLLLAAHACGTVAQLMLTMALGVEVLARTGSGAWVSVTVALGFAPYVLASGYAGLLADRHSRSATMTWSLTLRAACAAVLAVGLPSAWPVPLLVGVAAAAAFAATPAYPALCAATGQCVPAASLPAANALVTGVVNLTWMAGPGLLGVLLMLGRGPAVAAATATALFVLGSGLSLRVRLPRPAGRVHPQRLGPELLAGLRAVVRIVAIRRPMLAAVLDNFLYGYLVVALVLLATETFDGDRAIGMLNAALSLGGLFALLLANGLAARFSLSRLLVAALTGFGIVAFGAGLSSWLIVTVVLAGLAGAASLLAEVTAVTLLQRAAPDRLTARVFGVYDQLNVGAIALGSLIAGPLAGAVGSRAAIVLVALSCLVASATAGHLGRRVGGRIRADGPGI